MADIQIEAAAHTVLSDIAHRSGPFWISTTTAYVVYLDSGDDLVYQKTTDGGASWNGQVEISGSVNVGYDAWADWQTAGDTGTKIHIAYLDTTTDNIMYAYIDTSDDSTGTDIVSAALGDGAIRDFNDRRLSKISITKSRANSGTSNICVAVIHLDAATGYGYGFFTSPDGDTWTSKNTPWEAVNADYILLFPGNEADGNDIWAVFLDNSATALSLKTFDNSGNTWAEQAISSGIAGPSVYYQFDGQVRLSDGHLILAAWNAFDSATADLLVWDINGAGSITAKTNIITDTAEYINCSVFINQVNDDIYVAYNGGTTFGSVIACLYKKSTDGGGTWGNGTAMQADAEDDERFVSAGAIKAANGGKFLPIWYNDDLDDLFCNTDNAVSIAASAGGALFTPFYYLGANRS